MSKYQREYEDCVSRCWRNRIQPLPFRKWLIEIKNIEVEWETAGHEWAARPDEASQ